LTLLAVLATATSASASFKPIRRDHGETTLPRLRAGTITIPKAHARGRVTVIARLGLAPLAAWNADRGLASARRLDVRGTAAQAYLARVDAAQAKAIAQLRTAIPQARVGYRYRVLLDGFAVSVPVKKLPTLARLGFVTRLYPNVSYSVTMDRGPSVIQADTLEAATGSRGDGVKIAVVDTGVDWRSPFLNADGYSYPAGFPKGDTTKTSPKVIVARNFAGPVTDKAGRLAFDPTEPHGTHVAGIAAGDAGTTAPAGRDHPTTANLSGVAPRAYIGNYRVFNVPTPIGHIANTPQIVAAFERAVVDGMDVINFSGGGAQTDPVNDAMYETVRNVAAAGVVPVIAAGNDREDFGMGTTGSPGTAPEAISVAAVSNRHVFAPALTVMGGAPPQLQTIPIQSAGGAKLPAGWGTLDQTIVDVSTIVGTDAKPVDPYLCGSASSPNAGTGTLPAGSLTGSIALALRGRCTFVSKEARAKKAGATGLILIDNRFGEANGIPIRLSIGAGMISDLDGQRLRAFLAGTGGRAKIRVSTDIREIETERSGIITSFSSAGPTNFGHELKPDVSAPGLEVLSSTPPATTGSTFSVFAGTSMATPHIAGAAAVLVQRHPTWTAANVKSALMSTAGAAWGDTARTQEAPVWFEGAGLANVAAADDPQIFTDPQSLSFHDVDISTTAQHRAMLVTVTDAGNGSGTWTVELRPQAQTSGVTIDVPGGITITPGGDVTMPVVVRTAADAGLGDNYGFVVLRRGTVERRVPYGFIVERPTLRDAPVTKLQKLQIGDTRKGTSRVSAYCCPSEPFGPPPAYVGKPMDEDGAEQLYSVDIEQPVANFGVSILASTGLVDPFVLGSKDENDVQGYAGTPVDVNDLTFDAHVDVGAAGAQFPRLQRFYVSVDSRADPFTGGSLKGRYLLNAWIDDVTPPFVRMLTTRVAAGRPLLVAQAVDLQSGVDPLSIVIAYKRVLLGASAYDAASGLILFGIPANAPKLAKGKTPAILQVQDFQETKNINTPGDDIFPNTAFRPVRIKVVAGPALTWVLPFANDCAAKPRERLVVTGSSTAKATKVAFRVDGRLVGIDRSGPGGVWALAWKTAGVKKGKHHVTATLFDRAGRSDTAGRTVRICK
jgi:subtilisin family serine protease